MTDTLAGMSGSTRGKRVAVTTTASSLCAKAIGIEAARAATKVAMRIGILSGVVPDTTNRVDESSKAGLRTRE
jgi:hypothetical protein